MNAQQVALVQKSFERIGPSAEAVVGIFYDRLFELDPALRRLFTTDLKVQGQKFMHSLALVVVGLHTPEQMMASMRELGQRHTGYGATPQDYDTVCDALMWTLAQRLGDDFTPEVEAAWQAAYALLVEQMLDAN